MELKDLISLIKEKTGYSNSRIAKELDVSKPTISRWLSGEVTRIQEDKATKLSKLVGYDITKVIDDNLLIFKKPILGSVKAGYNFFLEDNYIGEEEVTYEEYNKGDFFLQVVGDSMIYDGIMDGSLLYCRRVNHINNGKIGVVQIGDEVTVKRVISKKDILILEAANPLVENRYFSAQEINELPVRIIGEVIFCKTNLQ